MKMVEKEEEEVGSVSFRSSLIEIGIVEFKNEFESILKREERRKMK